MSTDLIPLPSASGLLALPEAEIPEWFALPEAARLRVNRLLGAFAPLLRAQRGRLVAECKRVARQIQATAPLSWKTLYRLFNEWRAAGKNWRVLLCDYNCGKEPLDRKFVVFFTGLVGESSRADAVTAARERLLQKWYANEEIDGYGRLDQWWPQNRPGLPLPDGRIERVGDTPRGWSETNLRRQLPRRRATRKLMREGFFAAHGDLPQLLRDRALLKALELIAFDDVRLDLQTVFLVNGEWQIGYVNAVFALDVATGLILNYGLKPRWQRDDRTRVAITRAEVRFLLLRILENFGLPPWTVNILLEDSAAALTGQDKEHLQTILGDRIQFDSTGRLRRQLLTSGFLEEGGMPWKHGWIEAYFRKLHGALAHLDGATGRRYELDPGDRDGREKYALTVLKRAQAEGINADDLWLPFLRQQGEAEQVVAEVVHRLNWRTKHKLQGFDSVFEYRHPKNGWIDDRAFLALSPDARATCQPERRIEAPQERFDRMLRGVELTRPPALALLPLYEDRRPVRIRGGKVTVKTAESDSIIFWEENHPILTADEHQARELVGVLANDRSCIHLLTPELAFLDTVAREGRVHPLDQDALDRRGGAIHRDRQAVAREAAAYLAPREARYAAGRAQNDALFARAEGLGAAMVQGERAARKTRAKKSTAARVAAEADAEINRRLLAQSLST